MMNRQTISASLAAILLAVSSIGTAQARDDRDHRRDGPDRRDQQVQRHDNGRHGYGYDRHFHRGERLPSTYRGRGYVVNDWRARHLAPPPRGHQWVQVGHDQMLVAIATGVIAQLILSH